MRLRLAALAGVVLLGCPAEPAPAPDAVVAGGDVDAPTAPDVAVAPDVGPDGVPDVGPVDADADADVGSDAAPDVGTDATETVVAPPPVSLEVTITAPEGVTGSAVLDLTAVEPGAAPQRFLVPLGGVATLTDLPPGRYGALAFVDTDGDGAWTGTWSGDGEPAARLGLTLPRTDLQLPLRRGVQAPVLDGDPGWVALHDVAWALAEDHIQAGTTSNGFADHYMDEAFSEQIFQWDTCFMTLFGHHGLDAFPVMASLDNFYGAQQPDGYICRVVNEWDGEPGGDASDPSEPMINPPLFAWSELRYARRTGDLSRLPRVLPVLSGYHGWLDGNVQTGPGLLYTSMLGSGMDNAPRDAAYDGWVDITAQQALGRRQLAELYELVGATDAALQDAAEAEGWCEAIRGLMWDEAEGFFFDLGFGGGFLTDKTLASIWPLVAGCATAEQTARVVDHLADPGEFWRVHAFPSTAADSPAYDPAGHYWRGGVWAPTTYATIEALARAGRHDLARKAAESHLRALHEVYVDYVPAPGELADDEGGLGDGLQTLWELYAPDAMRPGTRWDATYPGRQDFVGWTGLGPIALLVERVIGLTPDAVADRLEWRVTRTDRHGVLGYRFGDQLVDVIALPRAGPEAPLEVQVSSSDAFELVVRLGDGAEVLQVPRGDATFTVAPPAGARALSLVPSGPIPGHAVLGNGQISVAWTDAPVHGGAHGPGVAHLYLGSFGLDLVESARLVPEAGDEGASRVGLDPWFAAYGEASLGDDGVVWRAFVGEPDALVVQGAVLGGPIAPTVQVGLRPSPHIDGELLWVGSGVDEALEAPWAQLTDGTAIVLATAPSGEAVSDDQTLSVALEVGGVGAETPFRWTLAVGEDLETALATAAEVLAAPDPLDEAAAHWAAWAPAEGCSDPACRVAAANLYAARASSLGGQVPADLTGQFVTNGFPQLYPRDALMVARVFEAHGHDAAAWEIVHDWLGTDRAQPEPGSWYARYDALGRAVDAGTGAAYDVPEWDANGYLAALVERLGPEALPAEERAVLLEALDFLVATQDADGLWTEGGIVEWVGRLPSTTTTTWVGLDAGARLAEGWGEPDRAASYRAAAGRLRGGLLGLVDLDGPVLSDQRDGGFAYDTAVMFGPAWGYPPGPLLDRSQAWHLEHARAHGGGVRYFEGLGYGQDLFWFTTAAATEYAAATGDTWRAETLVDWMTAWSNGYGLAPERLYQDGSGAAEATPLSWCAAELAMAIASVRQVRDAPPPLEVDGVVDWSTYRRHGGRCSVDMDGRPDGSADPVALCAAEAGDALRVGVRTAGAPGGTAGYTLYLGGADGLGPIAATAAGAPLTLRAAPGATPGARAVVAVDAGEGTCSVTEGEATCGEVAVGPLGLEVAVNLPDGPPAQVVLATTDAEGEHLVPPHGSLAPGADEGTVVVTFEADATVAAPAGVITLSGDRPELGAWAPMAIPMGDAGAGGDAVAGDGIWTARVALPRGGSVAYKYLAGAPGEASWDGVEFTGPDRMLPVEDVDASGRVRVRDVWGSPEGSVITDL